MNSINYHSYFLYEKKKSKIQMLSDNYYLEHL